MVKGNSQIFPGLASGIVTSVYFLDDLIQALLSHNELPKPVQ